MSLQLPATLPIARYRFHVHLHTPLRLPAYAGSTLRGILGHALLDTVCTCHRPPNANERHYPTCPYTQIFSAPEADSSLPASIRRSPPQAYIIETPFNGDTDFPADTEYTFDMVLIGALRLMLPLLCQAFQLAFQRGVNRNGGHGELINLSCQQADYTWQTLGLPPYIPQHINHLTLPDTYSEHLCLRWHTPLRLEIQQKVIRDGQQINEQMLAKQLLWRISTLLKIHTHTEISHHYADLIASAQRIHGHKNLHWADWGRYSNRQHSSMKIGGLMGSWQLYDLPKPWAKLLHLGQWLHIGKETVFGHGHYTLHNR